MNKALLGQLDPSTLTVELREHSEAVEEAECDEMWSFVGSKEQQRWLWYAIDHATGKLLAYVFGDRKEEAFVRLKVLLASFGITRFYTDDWGAYERPIEPENHIIGKENTQKIERKNLTNTHQAIGSENDMLFQKDSDVRHCDWLVHQSNRVYL